MMVAAPIAVLERLHDAMNRHDLEAFVGCFNADYESEQPCHPDRAFTGTAQVRKNWTTLFAAMPDFRGELLRWSVDGEVIWTEWHWRGTQRDGTEIDMRGIILFGVADNRIDWGRLYMQPVEANGEDIDQSLDRFRR
jgi:ketosteroid isomerase-like protein